jgi:hypothetical protein
MGQDVCDIFDFEYRMNRSWLGTITVVEEIHEANHIDVGEILKSQLERICLSCYVNVKFLTFTIFTYRSFSQSLI